MAKSKLDPRQCRCLTVDGHQCHNKAVLGESFCTFHKQHRRPVCPQKDAVDMPLLEDLPAIRLVISQVAHGLFTETIDPGYAGKILYACQVAAMTVPRPAPVKIEPVRDEGPVDETFTDTNGEVLGPDRPWLGVNGRFEPVWSRDKMLYEQECERLGKPKPTCPADMPPEGWLTADEQAEDRWTWPDRWMIRILEARIQKDQAGNLPPLQNRACSYDNENCRGPVKRTSYVVCEYCDWEGEAHERIARGEQDPVPPRVRDLCAKKRLRLTIFADQASESRGSEGAPFKPSSGCCGSGDNSIDDPEETEVLDAHKATLLNMRQCADEVGTLPPLEQRTCYYEMPDCAGPASASPCTYCRRERDSWRKLHKDGNNLDLNASAAPNTERSRLAAEPAPVVNFVNTAKLHIPRALHCRQLYRARPLNLKATPLRYPVGNTPYGISPGIPLRSLRHRDESAQGLVRHPVRRCSAHRSAVEHRVGERFRRAALLRRIARAGVHQPLVRFHLHSGEAGLHRRPLRPRLISAPDRGWLRRRSCAGCPADLRRAARRAARIPGIPASTRGARSAGWRGCLPK